MTWNPVLDKAPSPQEAVWATNDDVKAAWRAHVAKRGAKNTQRNLTIYVNVFVAMFRPLVTTLERPDIEAFMERMSGKCSKLINGRNPMCRIGHDVAGCPLLTAGTPTACADYTPLDPSGLWSYICAINRFYDWMLEEGRIAKNPALGVMRDFASRHSMLFDERRRKPRRRILKLPDIQQLVLSSPLHHAIGYVIMASGFLRIHELLKLRIDTEYLNLEEGWMDIPVDWDLGNKRKGNKRIILNAETRRWMRQYLAWREVHVKRDERGAEMTKSLMITVFGNPWGAAATHNFNTALHTNAIRLGLMTGNEVARQERVNSHCFRAFATTWARAKGASISDIMLLRGDLSGNGGTIDRYDDYLSRLPLLYQKYGPVLGV